MIKKTSAFIAVILAVGTLVASNVKADTIIDYWSFTYDDDTGLADALSNNGTSLGGNSEFASVQANALVFSSTNLTGSPTTLSTFRNTDLSQDAINSGQLEVSWNYVSASMANTDAADGQARVGFGLRDTVPSNDDFAFVRLQYTGVANQFELQYQDDTITSPLTIATFAGNTIANLFIRYVVDFDNAGNAGSFQVYYTLGAGSEVTALATGVIDAGKQVDSFRTAQQVTNGGTDWRAGDTMVVDDLTVSVVPEPSIIAFMGIGAAVMFFRRRKLIK